MKASRRAGSTKIVLVLVLLATVLVLGKEIVAYRHQMSQAPVPSLTIPQALATLASHLNPRAFPYLNSTYAALLKADLSNPAALTPDKRQQTAVLYAEQLLKAGQTGPGGSTRGALC